LDLIIYTLTTDNEEYLKVVQKIDRKALDVSAKIFSELISSFCYNYNIYDYLGPVYMRVGSC